MGHCESLCKHGADAWPMASCVRGAEACWLRMQMTRITATVYEFTFPYNAPGKLQWMTRSLH